MCQRRVRLLVHPLPAQAAENDSRSVRLGGVKVELAKGTRQVVTVKQRTGYGGLVPGDDRQQGTGTTPLGSYRVTETFGLARRPKGTELPFHRVRSGDYWVQDNESRWYNTLRNKHKGGFRWRISGYNSSVRLREYTSQYRWSIVIDFNRPNPVRHRGSGIFLHVNGSGATAGVSRTAGVPPSPGRPRR